jgi:putative peptidoglycan lipid II flippase
MTTPGSQAGPTAGDSDSADSAADSAGWTVAPGLARPYANPAREYITVPEPPSGRPAAAAPGIAGAKRGPEVELPPGWPAAARNRTGSAWSDFGPGDHLGSETGENPLPADTWPGPGLEDLPGESPDQAARDAVGTDEAGTDAAQRTAADGRAGTGGPGQGSGAGTASASGQGVSPPGSDGASIVRSSGVMAVGTIASRVTGFVRTAILIYALGTHDLGNAYQLANTVPNAVYSLALGGILTSVVVPLLVSAAKRDSDRGEAYDQRIFTLGVLALGVITVVATAAAAPITDLYGHGIGNSATHHLTVLFAYFFLPQIFFYGVSSLAGAILNARGRFGAPMWTPVINNLVVIVIGGGFMLIAGLNRTPQNISAGEIQLLGIGTTLGIVAQTAALIPSLRKVGFRWRPRFDFRRAEVSEIGQMGGWMFGYVLTTQASFLVTAVVANAAGAKVSQADPGAGYAAYSNAWQLFQLPYAIVGISVITAMLPRMSSHAASRNFGLVRDDFSGAARLASVIVVPAALVLAVLGEPLSEALFGYGSTSVASARYLGEIFAVFSLGLLPYMVFQLQLRVFYAMHDSRTPALIGLAAMAANIGANLLALAILPPRLVVAGLGVGFGLANLTGAVIAWRVLSRRIGGLDGHTVASSLVRMHLASLAPACFAIAISLMIGVLLPAGRLGAFVIIALAGSGGVLLYVMFARALRVSELAGLTETVTARFRR